MFFKCGLHCSSEYLSENSPLVIHEAQSCKVPVITADFGGMKEYVQHNVNGLLFEHRNANSLAEQMKFSVSNPDKMKTLGEKVICIPRRKRSKYSRPLQRKKTFTANSFTNFGVLRLTQILKIVIWVAQCEEHSPFSTYIKEKLNGKHRRMPKEWLGTNFEQAKNRCYGNDTVHNGRTANLQTFCSLHWVVLQIQHQDEFDN